MKIDNPELQKEFYELVKRDYPTMTPEEIRECTSFQYQHTRNNIQGGKLPVIRLTYFGTFLVLRGRAEGTLVTMKRKFEELKMDGKDYFKYKNQLELFLEKYKDDTTINEERDELSDTEVD